MNYYSLNYQGEISLLGGFREYLAWITDNNIDTPIIIGRDECAGFLVSTIFLSLDHNHSFTDEAAEPLVFETMIFDCKGLGVSQTRYSTKAEAEKSHKHITTSLTSTILPALARCGSFRRFKKSMGFKTGSNSMFSSNRAARIWFSKTRRQYSKTLRTN